jgi:hypothetical protein
MDVFIIMVQIFHFQLLPEFNALAVQPLMNALAFYEDMAEEQPQAANGLAASPDNDP